MIQGKSFSTSVVLVGLMLAGSLTATAQGKPPLRSKATGKAPKGHFEGIKVHGHWTVEVRNPDGKLVTHREFENSLVPFVLGNGLGGAYTLGLLFLGDAPPQGFQMVLSGPTVDQDPCLNSQNPIPSASCILEENIPATGPNAPFCPSGSQSVFCSLTRTPAVGSLQGLGGNNLLQPISFQGSFTAAQTGSVGNVALNVNLCSGTATRGGISEADCVMGNYPSGIIVNTFPFTATTLSSPVPVLAGQIVSAAVVISFQ